MIRPIDSADLAYVLSSWRESHKQSPGCDKVPWSYYKDTYGAMFRRLLDDPTTRVLGDYFDGGPLRGYVVFTPGKRVHTLHWIAVKHTVGGAGQRRLGVATALLEAAGIGNRFIYTLRAQRRKAKLPDGTTSKSLDELLVAALAKRGVIAAYTPLKEWLQ